MLVHSPPPAQVPLCPPTPSPSLTPTTPFSSTYSSAPSSVPEAPAHDTEIDDPFLVSFADLDGLLKDSTLFENPTSASPCSDVPFVFPLQEDGLLQDLSECMSLCSPSLSPHCDTPLTPVSLDLPQTNPTLLASLPSPEASILHDHTYTSSLYSSTNAGNTSRKRKVSTTDSLLSPVSTDSECPPPKQKKSLVKDDQYHSRRQKNNVASQVSRSKRRVRYRNLDSRVTELEKANAELRERARQMEAEAEALRKKLVQKLSA